MQTVERVRPLSRVPMMAFSQYRVSISSFLLSSSPHSGAAVHTISWCLARNVQFLVLSSAILVAIIALIPPRILSATVASLLAFQILVQPVSPSVSTAQAAARNFLTRRDQSSHDARCALKHVNKLSISVSCLTHSKLEQYVLCMVPLRCKVSQCAHQLCVASNTCHGRTLLQGLIQKMTCANLDPPLLLFPVVDPLVATSLPQTLEI